MPKALERKLKRQARKKGFVSDGLSERGRRYVYGTLRRTGWKPSHQKHHSQAVDPRIPFTEEPFPGAKCKPKR